MRLATALTAGLLLTAVVGVAGPRTGADADEEANVQIDIYEGNPRYWQVDGKPVLLLGGSSEDNLFQVEGLVEELDTIAACGGNYVRCTMSCRDKGNVWPFGEADDGCYDLDTWNEEFWRRFEAFLAETEKRGIVTQVELWATFDYYRDEWAVNPFNPANNVNYTAEESGLPTEVTTHPTRTDNNFFWSVPAENDVEVVLRYQRRFVDAILDRSFRHGNVLYCMDNETSVTPQWARYWANYVREAAARAGVRVHTTEMWDPHSLRHPMHAETFDNPELYTFVDVSQNNHNTGQEHYDGALWARERIADAVRPLNCVKTYGADTGSYGTSRDAKHRFWRNVWAGFAATRFHRPRSGIGIGGEAQKMIRAARDVTDAFDVFSCEPRPDLLGERGPDEAYCLADAGDTYVVYFPNGGSVLLDVSEAEAGVEMVWYDIERPGWDARFGGAGKPQARLELTTPADGQWAALVKAR